VTALEGDATPAASNVVDLAELLRKRLAARKPAAHRARADAAPTQASADRTVGRKAAPARAARAAKARRAA
jgi:non-homologous end joining protein Ku